MKKCNAANAILLLKFYNIKIFAHSQNPILVELRRTNYQICRKYNSTWRFSMPRAERNKKAAAKALAKAAAQPGQSKLTSLF